MTPVMKIFVILLGEARVWSRILENAHLKMDPVTGKKKSHIRITHQKTTFKIPGICTWI